MTIAKIAELLNAQVHCGQESLNRDVHSGCGCDMMSDVLAYVKDQAVMLTGLVNPQVIRTAEMMDIVCIVFVRGKKPTDAMIELANERSLTLLSTNHRMFSACGILYEHGLSDGGQIECSR
jgi:predicted transcriptional regulator